MAYVIPFSTKVHNDVAQFGFRTDARVVTRKNHPVKIVWTQDGFQGFVQLKQSQLFLVWNKQGLCITFVSNSENKNYDLFYEVEEVKPNPARQMAFDASFYCCATLKATCRTEEVVPFNLDKYMSDGYDLETRNGYKIPALEFTGDEKKVFRGADNMRYLRWTRTGKINANGVEHELDLMMRKVRND